MSGPTASIAVTGSTGVLGGYVAAILGHAGIPQRLLVRNPAKAPAIPGAAVLPFSYADREAGLRALDGVDTLFMVSATESAHRLEEHRAFVDTAAAAGVARIVYTSLYAAAPDATFTLARDHYATEESIKASGMVPTFLRDNLYLDFVPSLVGDDGVIRGPAGTGRVAAVAREDIARVAAAVLQNPEGHAHRTYNLTGPEELTMEDAARIVSAATDTAVMFHNETLEEAYASRSRWGAPDWQVDAWVSTYTAIASGEMAGMSPDVERITGRGPMALAEFLRRQR
jgi:NAD(P)H dehydrogenase (quinone)